jgi:hypothetical protein
MLKQVVDTVPTVLYRPDYVACWIWSLKVKKRLLYIGRFIIFMLGLVNLNRYLRTILGCLELNRLKRMTL